MCELWKNKSIILLKENIMSTYITIEEVGKLVDSIFKTLPKPQLSPEFDMYGILNADSLSCRIWVSNRAYYDTYVTWIAAKALSSTPRRRKAVAIEWTTDELQIDPEGAIRRKLQIAASQFNELAEEFTEGGMLPKAWGVLKARSDEKRIVELDMMSARLSLSSLYWIVSAISEAKFDLVTCEVRNVATDGMKNLKAYLQSAVNAKASEYRIKQPKGEFTITSAKIRTPDYREMLSTLLEAILDPHSTSSNVISIANDLKTLYFSETQVKTPDGED